MNKNGYENFSSILHFPDIDPKNIEYPVISLEQIIFLSKQMLPFENKRRKKSAAATYNKFTL